MCWWWWFTDWLLCVMWRTAVCNVKVGVWRLLLVVMVYWLTAVCNVKVAVWRLVVVVRLVMWRKALVVVRTQDRRVMRSFRSTGVTAMRKCIVVVTRTQDAVSIYLSLITRTHCGGPRLSTTEYSTPNSRVTSDVMYRPSTNNVTVRYSFLGTSHGPALIMLLPGKNPGLVLSSIK